MQNREIKFRAWADKTDEELEARGKEMVYSDEFKNTQGLMEFFDLFRDDFKIMQYTGLKDKNGKEIYEGDIVKFITGEVFGIRQVVRFWKGAFVIGEQWLGEEKAIKGETSKEVIEREEVEVIGNIFEDLKLLKQDGN